MTRQELEALAIASYGHKAYEDMTDREHDDANEDAWAELAWKLRGRIEQGMDDEDARRQIDASLTSQLRGCEEAITRALKTRATRAHVRDGATAFREMALIGRQQGFVWDVSL
jgi:hypothetical protein